MIASVRCGTRARLALVMLVALGASSALAEPWTPQVDWDPAQYRVTCEELGCNNQQVYPVIEQHLSHMSGEFKRLKWKAHAGFGPVKTIGNKRYVVVTDVDEDTYAFARADCKGNASSMHFGRKLREVFARPHMLYYGFAHELFHVITRAYAAMNQCSERRYGWVNESLATAVGLHITRQRFPDAFPLTSSKGVTRDVFERERVTFAGLREYWMPLNWMGVKADGSFDESGQPRYYRTSSLWRHLAEVFHDDKMEYLQRYLALRPTNNDWLRWLDTNLQDTNGEVKRPLAFVFPLFVADFANWHVDAGPGEPRRPGHSYDEKEWYETAFGECVEVTLSPTQPTATFNKVLQRTAAGCVRVHVEGLKPRQTVAVNAMALVPKAKLDIVDQFWLGLAHSTDKVGFDCYRELRSTQQQGKLALLARDQCVFAHNTDEVELEGVKYAARLFHVHTQEVGKGSGFTNTYVLSRISPVPTDDPGNDGGARQTVTLRLSLDRPAGTIGSKPIGEAGNKRAVIHLNGAPASFAQETIPMFDKHGKPAMFGVTPGVVRPIATMPPFVGQASGAQAGISTVQVSEVEVQPDGLYQRSVVEGGTHLVATPLDAAGNKQRPLQIGDRGTFAAGVTGRIGTMMMVATKDPAKLVVEEYTPFVLRATVTGTLCNAVSTAKVDTCPDPQPFSISIVKAFAGFSDPKLRFEVEDTPGTKMYAQAFKTLMDEARPRVKNTEPMESALEQGPSQAGAVKLGDCSCSCDDRPYLDRLQKALKGGAKINKTVMAHLKGRMRCKATCEPHYRTCAAP